MVSSLLSIANVFDTACRFLIFGKKIESHIIAQPFTRLFAPLAGVLLQLSIRPSFYFSSDQLASEMLKNRDDVSEKDLAEALWKLNSYALTEPFQCPISMSHMFVVNPLTSEKWNSYFHAQPSANNRIRALIGHYPI